MQYRSHSSCQKKFGGTGINESTVCGFKKAYLNELRSKRLREEEDLTVQELSTRQQRNKLQRWQFLFQYIILLQKLQSKFLRIHGNLECTSPYETPLFQQLAFNKINYTRELNYCERYHTRELMSFQFYIVANFIRNKNPLYGTINKCKN